MQEIGYTGDEEAEKPHTGQWDSSEISHSKKPLWYSGLGFPGGGEPPECSSQGCLEGVTRRDTGSARDTAQRRDGGIFHFFLSTLWNPTITSH